MSEEMNEYEKNASDKIKKVVAAIKEKTAMTAYQLKIIKDSEPDIFDSKFGGVPYWDLSKEYPIDSYGNKMMLLAQINFTKEALADKRLPQQGMLQFFIINGDDLYGMDFEELDSQKDFRVIYHETVNMDVTKEQVLVLDIPIATDEDNEFSPLGKEAAIEFHKTTTYMGTEVVTFEKLFAQTLKELTGEDMGEMSTYSYLSKEDNDYLYDQLFNTGHWLLGYPFFTQYDPRDEETTAYYDTMLFQMDSEMAEGRDYVLWGDCGVGNFFINSEALKKKDFSKVMYSWDCC